MAFGYATNSGPRPLYRINPANGTIAQTITTVFQPPGSKDDVTNFGLAYGAGYLWAFGYSVNGGPRPLYKINPTNGTIAQTITTVFRPPAYGEDVANFGLAYGGGYLWAFGYSVSGGSRPLFKINLADGTIAQTITSVFRPPAYGEDLTDFGLAYRGGYLWAFGYSVSGGPRPLYKINPANGTIAQTITTVFRPPAYGEDVANFGLAFEDVTLPAGSISINAGNTSTAVLGVALTVSASDAGSGVAEMRFSNDNSNWSVWEAFSTNKTWTLSSGDGTKTVYVQFKDATGNASGSYSDSILLDTLPPAGSISINGGATTTATQTVSLSLTGSDGGSGVARMRFSNNGSAWSNWEAFAVSRSWILPSGDGLKTVYAQFTDSAGNVSAVFSDSIMVNSAPITITLGPTNQTAVAGETVIFTLEATGTLPLSYQWRKDFTNLVDGGNLSGATTKQLTLSNVQLNDAGTYWVVVSNAYDTLTSTEAKLTVIAFPGNFKYFVTSNSYGPQVDWSLAVKQEFGTNAEVVDWNTLKSDFGGSIDAIRGLFDYLGILAFPLGDAPAVTWNGSQIWSGSRSYGVNRLEGIVPGGYLVHDQIQNYWACLGSWPADRRIIGRFALSAPPGITSQPQSCTNAVGATASFSVTATGTAPLSYQWRFNTTNLVDGGNVSGAATATLAIADVQLGDAGSYSVVVSNTSGSVTSLVVTLTVTASTGPNLKAMGGVDFGQLGIGFFGYTTPPTAAATGVAQVAAGYNHSLFVKTDGTLWAMGDNTYGQLGDGTTTNRSTAVQVASDVARAAASWNYSLFVKTDGTLWAMGGNNYGQLGDGTTTQRNRPVQVATGVAQVAAGHYHCLFVKTNGTLWAMGNNYAGQLGDGTTIQRSLPVQVATAVAQVVAGESHSLFVKSDGTLWAMGDNRFGQLGDGTTTQSILPVLVSSAVQRIAAGAYYSLFVKTDGTLWAMGYSDSGQLGLSVTTPPVQVATGVTEITAGYDHSLFVKTDRTLWAAGKNNYGQLGDGTRTTRPAPVQVAADVAQIATSASWHYAHSLFVKTDGTLYVMGSNSSGQLGNSMATSRTRPVPVAAGVACVAAGYNHSLFVRSDGTLWATGDNTYGQLGDGTTIDRSAAVQVATGVVAVAGGEGHSLYVKSDGTLWAMGNNWAGDLGDGTTISRPTAVMVASEVLSVAASYAHSLYVKSDGTLWAMGYNGSGQLGDGTTVSRSTAVPVASGVAAAAAGAGHSLYVKSDGTLWAMGNNAYGQLGDGTKVNRSTPVPVASGVVAVAAVGFSKSIYLKSDGTLWAMGDGTSIPWQEATGIVHIAAGIYHTLFVKSDGTLWVMGENSSGQLGDGTTTYRSSPVQVATGVSQVAAGMYHTLFLQDSTIDSPLVITTQPISQTKEPGQNAAFNVTAAGAAPLTYQWRRNSTNLTNGGNISGVNTTMLSIANVQLGDAGSYSVVVSNASGSVTSAIAVLTVVTSMFESRVINLDARVHGDNSTDPRPEVTLAAGQWMVTPVNPSLDTNALFTSWSAWSSGPWTWSFDVHGSSGTVLLRVADEWHTTGDEAFQARLPQSPFVFSLDEPDTVNFRFLDKILYDNSGGISFRLERYDAACHSPLIIAQPMSRTNAAGGQVLFEVQASGSPPLSYQWRKDGMVLTDGGRITGSTSSNLVISALAPFDAAGYSVVVTNNCGSVTSSVATLTILSPPVQTLAGLYFTNMILLADGRAQLELIAPSNGVYSLLASTNLSDWESVKTLDEPTNRFIITWPKPPRRVDDVDSLFLRAAVGLVPRYKFYLNFHSQAGNLVVGTPNLTFPQHISDYTAELELDRVANLAAPASVSFTGPPGSGLTNAMAGGADLDPGNFDGHYWAAPSLANPSVPPPGRWAINYAGTNLFFDQPDAQARFVIPHPTFVVSNGTLVSVGWIYRNATTGQPLVGPPAFLKEVVVEVFGGTPAQKIYDSAHLRRETSEHTFSPTLLWSEVTALDLSYYDDLDNYYVVYYSK